MLDTPKHQAPLTDPAAHDWEAPVAKSTHALGACCDGDDVLYL